MHGRGFFPLNFDLTSITLVSLQGPYHLCVLKKTDTGIERGEITRKKDDWSFFSDKKYLKRQSWSHGSNIIVVCGPETKGKQQFPHWKKRTVRILPPKSSTIPSYQNKTPEQFQRGGVIEGKWREEWKKLQSQISICVNINATVCPVHTFQRVLLSFLWGYKAVSKTTLTILKTQNGYKVLALWRIIIRDYISIWILTLFLFQNLCCLPQRLVIHGAHCLSFLWCVIRGSECIFPDV